MIAPRQIFRQGMTSVVLVVASAHSATHCSLAKEVAIQKRADFNTSIQPMLASFCYECHGRKKTEAEINLAEITCQ
jgi:cytochrome c553